MLLTKRVIDAAIPDEKDRFLWDSQLRGFGLKITPAGNKVYVVQYRAGHGRGSPTRRITIGKHGSPWSPATARKEAMRFLGQVAGGADPAQVKQAGRRERQARGSLFRDVAEEWLKRDQANRRTLYEIQRILTRDVLPVLGDMPVAAVRKRDIIVMLDAIVDRGAGTLANRALSLVKRMLSWAASRDIVEANVAHYVEPPADKVSRDRVLSDAELVDVWRAAETIGGPYGAGVKLLMLTGARRAEIFGLHEGELDLDGAAIRLPAARVKNAEGRTIPLSPQAGAVLAALPRIGPYLLSGSGARPKSDHSRGKLQLDALLPDMTPWVIHDIRRSVATGLQRIGVRLEAIEAVLGHIAGSRRGVVGVYQRHSFEPEARAALDSWGRHVEGLVTGASGAVVPMIRKG